MALFFATSRFTALLHLQPPKFAQALVLLAKNQSTRKTFFYTGRISPAVIAFKRLAIIIGFDHSIGAGVHALTTAIAFLLINHHHPVFIFEDGLLRAGFQALRPGALKTDAGHGITI